MDAWTSSVVLMLPFLLFVLANIVFVVVSLSVSFRHLRHARFATAACYASLPFIAFIIAIASNWAGATVGTELTLQRYDQMIIAAKKAGTIMNTNEIWINPGPPTRARFSHGGSIFSAIYIVYAEKSDYTWLQERIDECKARPTLLGRNYYEITGSC